MRALAVQDPPPGLLGYRGKTPVGWVSLGPRDDFAKLAKSPAMKPVDDQPVWSVVCFVVPSEFRGQGVAGELIAGAVAYARKRGVRLMEAYPVDKVRRRRAGIVVRLEGDVRRSRLRGGRPPGPTGRSRACS